jgi:2-polyprenyl-6-methoxyphenol hydroxylase-like FAD-dependent oxidoreductase
MRAIVVGGGIGGLASAVALLRAGWDVEVFERAPEFTEAGAGLSLWPNALRAGEPDIAGRLAGYDQRRRPRTQMIARQSARIGVMAQWASPVAVALRNAGLRLLPASALARSLAPALKWDG